MKKIASWLTENFDIDYPIIMAPMFLVSNVEMLKKAAEARIMGCIPALNFRTIEEFETALKDLKENCHGPFGVNLIVNKSNIKVKDQLKALEKYPVDFVITSLGNPKETIKRLSKVGTKTFCDVTDLKFAKKVEQLGADAIIAVNSGAGGHAGPIAASILVPQLKKHCKIPVISAGGIGTGDGLVSMLALGADGVSIGTPFIATTECLVSKEYKDAIIKYGAEDIALTTKISGSPCTVIKTDYVKKIGLDQNFIESFLSKNKKLKKYAKMLTYFKGTNLLEKAAFSATYKTVWCAGPSLEFVTKEQSIKNFVALLIKEAKESFRDLKV